MIDQALYLVASVLNAYTMVLLVTCAVCTRRVVETGCTHYLNSKMQFTLELGSPVVSFKSQL